MTIEALTSAQHQRLATWFGAGFPVGAFSYSHGLEAAFEAGLVTDRDSLIEWIEGLFLFGSGRNDAILFAQAYRFAPDVEPIAEIAAALSPSAELRAETLNQGEAFLKAVQAGWPNLFEHRNKSVARQREGQSGASRREISAVRQPVFLANGGSGSSMGNEIPKAFPVAAGLCCARSAIPLHPSLLAYLHAFAANVVSAALRSMPIGQSDGLSVQGHLEAAISQTAEAALAADLDDIGSATPMLDWLSATHETQYSRLFRS